MSDIPPNIQRFNLTALRLFTQLYDAFPTSIDIETSDLGAESAPAGIDPAAILDYAMRADEVIDWLEEEGFIRTSGKNLGTLVVGVRLTLKGLTLLGYIPTSITPTETSEPLINKMKKALSSGVEQAAAEGVKNLVGGIFRLAYSYAANSAGSSITLSA
jgi:hypothetical protein